MRTIVPLLLALLVAGCAAPPPDGPDEGPTDGSKQAARTAPEAWRLEAPVWEAGRSWTYQAGGFWELLDELTIVVAEAGPTGYLLAAATREQLVNEIAWDLPYFGRRGLDLAPVAGEDTHTGPLLVFPLEENATWTYGEIALRAEWAALQVMGASLEGVRITGGDDTYGVLVEYAPSVGYITKYEETWGSIGVAWSLTLKTVDQSSDWAWFEQADMIATGGLADRAGTWDPATAPSRVKTPAELIVQEGDDAVLVWWLGSERSRGYIVPPPGGPAPIVHDGTGAAGVVAAFLPATPGSWRFSGTPGAPDGWAYYQGHAVRWIGP